MRFIVISIFLATTALAGGTNTFQLFHVVDYPNTVKPFVTTNRQGKPIVVHEFPQPVLEPSKALLVTDGMTLGQVVSNIGPGWREGGEGAGLVHWSFADGRELTVDPCNYTADEVISTNETARCRFWFAPIHTNVMFAFARSGRNTNRLSVVEQEVSTRSFKIQPDTFFIGLKKRIVPMEGEFDIELLGRYFQERHIDFDHPKFAMFWNDRLGKLVVRATPADLDKIEQIVSDITSDN